jgi:hypothetical protein
MPESPRSANSQRSWRQKASATPTGDSSKMFRRILFSLLGATLTGLLVWLIWWWFFLPVTYFACLPIVDYDVLAVPPIPFSHEDAAEFANLGPSSRTAILSDLQTSEGIATLSNRLQGMALRPKDVLILWIDAHGVSDDGTAYLLASDYLRSPNSPNSGRYKLHDLLTQIHECPVGVKLLILDANHLAYDPRLEMIVNEFPRLLEAELKSCNDPAIWVLSAAGPMQLSQISRAKKRSIFGETVTEALRGAADENRNGTVEFDELVRFVQREVPKRAGVVSSEPQFPRLFLAGVGTAEPPEKIALAPISPLSKGEEPEVRAASDGPSTSDTTKKTPDDRTEFQKLLQKAWGLRDRLQDRSQNEGWSPVDYAPHLWREFNELLLGYERRYRGGSAFNEKDLFANLKENILAWDDLVESNSGGAKASVIGRLSAARRDFLKSPAKARLDRKVELTVAMKNAIQLKNDLVFWSPYYVRWHEAAARLSDRQLPLYAPLCRVLEKLPAFCELLESRLALNNANGPSSADRILENTAEELSQLRDALANGVLLANANNLLETAKKNPLPTIAAEAEAITSTPLLSGDIREKLLELSEKLAASPSGVTSLKSPDVPRWRWDRLAEQSKLEGLLVLLADPAAKIIAPELIPSVDGPDAENKAWLGYRQLGKAYGVFYADIPRRINDVADAADKPALRSTERMLRLVDARDAVRIDAKALACAVPLLPEVERPKIQLSLIGEKSLELPRDGWQPFELSLQTGVTANSSAEILLQYDASLIEVVQAENKQALAPDKSISVAFEKESAKAVKFQARAKRRSPFETKLEIEAALSGQTARATMNFRLAPPDAVDLVAYEFGRLAEQASPSAEKLRLRPYPNRATIYRFALANRSGKARKVTVEFFPLPQPPEGEREFKDSPLDTLGNPRLGVKRLAEPVEISLPADDSPTAIVFPEPKPVEGEKEKPKTEKPATDKPGGQIAEATPKPAVPLDNGVACVIRDAETKQPRWLKRIEFLPRAPRDYLQPDVSYDAARGRISIRIASDEAQQSLPPLSPESPISIVWSNAGELPTDSTVKDRAAIASPGQTATLFADAATNPDKKITVRLTVDGYPRAFVYLVRIDRDRERIPRERSLEEIRIVSPPADRAAYRVPLEKPIPLELQVDAPEDSFRNEADSVQVAIVADDGERELCPEEHRKYFSDRQTSVGLADLAPSGDWKIETKVGDFNIPLGVGGLKNTRARIMGQITLANPNSPEDRISRKAFMPILLQGSPPVLGELIAPSVPIPQGTPIDAYLTVEKEHSAIKEVQFGIDRDNSGELEDADKPEKLHQAADGKWRVSLAADDLKPGRYTLIARATDAVGFAAKATRTITIAPPSVAVQKAGTTSSIAGLITLQDGRPLPRMNLKLQGTNFSAVSDDSGQFAMKDVPHGKYKLEARGTALGRNVSGVQEVILPGPSEPARVEMIIEW